MEEQKDNSSLPILLAIAGTVLLSVSIGWFLLDRYPQAEIDLSDSQAAVLQDAAGTEAAKEVPVSDIDATFRKARLAAAADNLAYPPKQSALHFYGRILAADPGHAIANAELDTVLSRISQTVTSYLAAREFGGAYELAQLVAKVRPDHVLVQEVQQTLDEISSDLVAQSMRHAQDGEDEYAKAVLVAAQKLPGRESDYFAAVRDSISEIKDSRKATETRKVDKLRRTAAQETNDWVEKVRGAIESGQLITPSGESARDYLAERSTPGAEKDQLTTELLGSLIVEVKTNIGLDQLPTAEKLLTAANGIGGDDAELTTLGDSLERAYIEAEENRIASTQEFVRLKTAPPRYPRRAAEALITGWVEVMFTVTSSGETDDIEVSQSSPEKVFDKAAIQAVEQWAFEPRVFRGQRISQRTAVRLIFEIE